MMLLSSAFLVAAAAFCFSPAVAHPHNKTSCSSPSEASFCLCDSDADVIGNDFAQLISNYSDAFAELVIADDYTDQSDSANTLIDNGGTSPIPVSISLLRSRHDPNNSLLQLGNLTFATKAAFLAGQGSQPNVPFKILNLWHTCDTVIIRWVATPGPQEVQGFDAILVQPSTNGFQPYQLKTVYGEFNSGAWLADLGHPECNATTT